MPEFTAEDALAIVRKQVVHAPGYNAQMALLDTARLIQDAITASQAPTPDLPPFPASSDYSPAPRRYQPRLAALTGGKWGVWDTERKGWVRITGYSPSAAEALSDQLNTPPVKI